jgi:6-phosphogluconate dehydrogenase
MGQQLAVVGLGVMGENLALNLERNGFPVAVYNRTWDTTERFLGGPGRGKRIVGARSYPDLVAALDRPRRILLMVKAGKAVDAVLSELIPLLEKGDIVIDGGNSHWSDTDRRIEANASTGIHFFGMGVSGGEEGALHGPSLMPGGDRAAYEHLAPILTRIAARTESGPCVTYVGAGSAGHFVKMVHNGIEYGDLQLICEAYDLLRHGLGLSPPELRQIFADWNAGELQSFLIEVTEKVVDFPDDRGSGRPLVDLILDRAGQKGTGKWTTQTALDLGVPIPTITAAVDARLISARKEERVVASRLYPMQAPPFEGDRKEAIAQVRAALYASKICSYAQGFALLAAASDAHAYGLDLGELARIWKGGCIIRAAFLDEIRKAFAQNPRLSNLLVDPSFRESVSARDPAWRNTVELGLRLGIAMPAMSASLAYFDSYRRERLPANLLQAQRDYFGAHTYERIDRPGTFHTRWQ